MTLEYTSKKTVKTTPVILFRKSKLCILKAWQVYLKDNYGDFDWTDESIVNIDAFDSYRINEYDPELPIKSMPTPMKSSIIIILSVHPTFFPAF